MKEKQDRYPWKPSSLRDLLATLSKWAQKTQNFQNSYWNHRQYFIGVVALTETAVLVAQHALDRHHFCSRLLFNHLIFSGGAAERICVSRLFFVGTLMTILGGLIRYTCYRALGRMFTFEMSIRRNHKLITSGPYAIVRHPSYVGSILVIGGMMLIHGSKVCCWLVLVISTEPISSGLLAYGEWYTEVHSHKDNHRTWLCNGYNGYRCITHADVIWGWGITSVCWKRMGGMDWKGSI